MVKVDDATVKFSPKLTIPTPGLPDPTLPGLGSDTSVNACDAITSTALFLSPAAMRAWMSGLFLT